MSSFVLHGNNAFYNRPDYEAVTKRELASKKLLPTTYRTDTESAVTRAVKQIFQILVFPIGIYKLLHSLVGKVALLPASSPTLMGYPENFAENCRSNISLNGEWKYKRLTIEVDGYQVDAVIVGKPSTLNNGRWVLSSNGNGEFYEGKLIYGHDFKQILSEMKGNAIVFNYPGVGASSGLPSREAMTKAYCAMLRFLEDQNGVGAKEIIGYGHSIGGGVQGDALEIHELKRGVKYLFIKSRTFSDLSTTASLITNRILGFLVRILGWNISSVGSSQKIQAPEIILQTARVNDCEELHDDSKIIHDGVIPAYATLAKALLPKKRKNQVFLGIKERHNSLLNIPSLLTQKIKALMDSSGY